MITISGPNTISWPHLQRWPVGGSSSCATVTDTISSTVHSVMTRCARNMPLSTASLCRLPIHSGRSSIRRTAGTAAALWFRCANQSFLRLHTTRRCGLEAKPCSATQRLSFGSTPARRAKPSRTTIPTPSAAARRVPSPKVAKAANWSLKKCHPNKIFNIILDLSVVTVTIQRTRYSDNVE